MIRPIVIHPDPVLRQTAQPLGTVTDETRTLLDDMLETMYAAPGRGLAAPQIGVLQRAIVLDVEWKTGPRNPMVLVDPELVWASNTKVGGQEGCLSIPDTPLMVSRFDRVRVRYLDRDGTPQEIDATGPLAVVLQHEIDHLDGVLIVDHGEPVPPAS
jgi:peptide deformylase